MVDWTHNISHFGIPVASKKTNPLPANDPVCDPEDVHDFGATSDLCTYCGISAGWFSRHEGKICNARKELRKLVKADEKKNQLDQQKANYDFALGLAALKTNLPLITISPSTGLTNVHNVDSCGCLACLASRAQDSAKPTIERPKRKSIGRKFR